MIGSLFFVLLAAVSHKGHPVAKHGSKSESPLRKRYLPDHHSQPLHEVNGNNRDFMSEVLDPELHTHHRKPDKWLDFFDNGAQWGHYMSPQFHHPATTLIHEQHYTANLNYNDPYEETNRIAASQENHVEAYPGELVSGENSLSKFIAPPVFDEPGESGSRDSINRKEKERHLVDTPEAQATETSNTKKLVDSLNSFMTPLKVPSDEGENVQHVKEPIGEATNWNTQSSETIGSERGRVDKQIQKILDSEGKVPQGEPGTPQFENSVQDMMHSDTPVGHSGMNSKGNNKEAEAEYYQNSHSNRNYSPREDHYALERFREQGHENRHKARFIENTSYRKNDPEEEFSQENDEIHEDPELRPHDNEEFRDSSEFRSRNNLEYENNKHHNGEFEHFVERQREGSDVFSESRDNTRSRDLSARDEMRDVEHETNNGDYESPNTEQSPLNFHSEQASFRSQDDRLPNSLKASLNEKPKPIEIIQDDHDFLKTIQNSETQESNLSHGVGAAEASLLPKGPRNKEATVNAT